MQFKLVHPNATEDHLGLIPMFLSEADPRPAREQFNENYSHGGGWRPFSGFTVTPGGIRYEGEPLLPIIAEARLRNEVIHVYDGAWVSITQPDGAVEISRMD